MNNMRERGNLIERAKERLDVYDLSVGSPDH
jgi:hypothetical protein